MTALPTRADYAAGLRQLADLIATTDGPLPKYGINVSGALSDGLDVELAARALDIPFIVQDYDDGARHFRALSMVGPVEIRLSHVEYRPQSIPGEGGEVADPDGRSGSATTPQDGHVYECCGKVGRISRHERWCSTNQPAAVPAPGEDGDGAAVTPDVWVPIRRRGILYHQLDGRYGGDYTDCGRAVRPNGTRLPLAEATAFGAVPCPRCYGGAA